VRKLEVGLIGDARLGRGIRVGLGGTVSHHFRPRQLRSAYGDDPRSYMIFARLGVGGG
jgi:hypothetical protein